MMKTSNNDSIELRSHRKHLTPDHFTFMIMSQVITYTNMKQSERWIHLQYNLYFENISWKVPLLILKQIEVEIFKHLQFKI